MNFRIGFPIVKDNDCFAIWVSNQQIEGNSTGIYFNGNQLNNQYPFKDNPNLNTIVKEILQNQTIYLECLNIPNDIKVGNQLDIKGRSAECCFEIIRNLPIADTFEPNVSLLFSATISDGKISALDSDNTRIKKDYALINKFVLILYPTDYDNVVDDIVQKKLFEKTPLNLEDLYSRIIEDGHGIIKRFPITPNGDWEGKKAWKEGIANFLKLTPLNNLSSANFQHSPTTNENSSELQNQDALESYIYQNGTIGELYKIATGQNNFEKFCSDNSNVFSLPLFEEGIAVEVLKEQDEVFHNREKSSYPQKHILIGGPTGCGKTFVAEAIILNEIFVGKGRAVYVAPTRALANEVHESLRNRTKNLLSKDDIVLSTGEDNDKDWRLNAGNFKIAVMVNEKANMFLKPKQDFLKRIDLLVIDEMHMITDFNRGGVIDLLIAKVSLENENRRANKDEHSLRIVGISTDQIENQGNIKEALTFNFQRGIPEKPLSYITPKRSVPIKHKIVLNETDTQKNEELEIHTFKEKIQLSKAEINEITDNISSVLCSNGLSNHKINYNTHLTDVILDYQNKYKQILIAIPSITDIFEVAKQLKNKRESTETLARGILPEKADLSELGARKAQDIKNFEKHGIYLHHSDIPKHIRHAVVKGFEKQPSHINIAEILLATETLFYGVNLAVDCVILSSIGDWVREDPIDGEFKENFLTRSEFHNIVGRAGRPGRYDNNIEPIAVFCINKKSYQKFQKKFNGRIEAYYSASPPSIESQLFSEIDLTKIENGTVNKLIDITYTTFRSILDSLRHANGKSKSSKDIPQIIAVLKKTVYWKWVIQTKSEESAKNLVKRVLMLAVQENVIEKDGENEDNYQFKITDKAEALIDTGTKWESVEPMGEWLLKLQELDNGENNLPIELLIPAFIASPDFWRGSATFLWARRQKQPDRAARFHYYVYVRNELVNEINEKLKFKRGEDILKLLESFVSSKVKSQNEEIEDYKTMAFFCMFLAFLRWVNGDSIENINILSQKLPPTGADENQKAFKDRYKEKAMWLANMCSKYFEKETYLIPPHKRLLPKFAERLRSGVPEEGLPLIHKKNSKLRREEVIKLLDQGIYAKNIISDESIDWGDLSELRSKSSKIRIDLSQFYSDQINNLVDGLIQEESSILENFKDDIDGFINDEFGKNCDIKVFKSNLLRYYTTMLKIDNRFEVKTEQNKITLSEKNVNKNNSLLKFNLISSDQESIDLEKNEIVIRIPWWEVSSTATNIELSATSAMILFYLIGRGFLEKTNQIFQWINDKEKKKSVRDLAELEMDTLPYHLREVMRKFFEPGV